MPHRLCSCSCCIHNLLETVAHFQFCVKEVLARDDRIVFELRADISIKNNFVHFFVCGLIFLWINLRMFFAFPVVLSIWRLQFKSLLIVTPRYLAEFATMSSLLCS